MARFTNSELAISCQIDLSFWRLDCLSLCDGRMEARLIPFDDSYDFDKFFYGSLGQTFTIGKDTYVIWSIDYSLELQSCAHNAQSFEIVAYKRETWEPPKPEASEGALTRLRQKWYSSKELPVGK